jgi:putative MATE family efflux protein
MMNLSNIVLNYLLIFGKFGFPEMGIKGAALATVIGRLWAFIVYGLLLMHIRRKQSGLCLAVSKIGYYAGSVITYGLPAAGEQISYNCSQFFVMVFITMLGTKSVTAYSYLNTCVGCIYMFSTALGQGTAIMIGWNVGAANYAEADRQCRFSGRCSLIVSMLVMFVVTIFRKSVFGLFTTDSEIISLACMVLLSNYIREIGRSQNLVYVNALRAAGDVKYPFLVGLVSMWGLSVGMTYVLGIRMGLGLMGVWIALGMDECFRAAMMHIRWHKKFRYSDVLCFFTQV